MNTIISVLMNTIMTTQIKYSYNYNIIMFVSVLLEKTLNFMHCLFSIIAIVPKGGATRNDACAHHAQTSADWTFILA